VRVGPSVGGKPPVIVTTESKRRVTGQRNKGNLAQERSLNNLRQKYVPLISPAKVEPSHRLDTDHQLLKINRKFDNKEKALEVQISKIDGRL